MKASETMSTLLKAHYEKVSAFVVLLVLLLSLLYLAIEISSLQLMQKEFDREIDMKPLHANAEALNVAPFEAALQNFVQPAQLALDAWGERRLFLPEDRVWCLYCRRPIGMEVWICPFCKYDKEEQVPRKDSDKDGIPDEWEKKWELNPMDPKDAADDKDRDGWSNLEEFGPDPKAEKPISDATDPKSTPGDWIFKLSLEKIEVVPFYLRFKSALVMPGGERKFQINVIRGNRTETHFLKLGETVEGWKLTKFEEKSEMKELRGVGVKSSIDISELTLTRDKKPVVLIKNVDKLWEDYKATLYFSVDKSTFSLKSGEVFELRGKKYRLTAVNKVDRENLESVDIERVEDGKVFNVRKKPAKE